MTEVIEVTDAQIDNTKVDETEVDNTEVKDIEVKDTEQAKGPVKILWLCRVIVNHPLLYFISGSIVHLFFVVLTMLLMFFGYDVLVLVFDDVPLMDREYEGYQCFAALHTLEFSRLKHGIDFGLFYADTDKYKLLTYFDGETKNILTSKCLEDIHKIEEVLFQQLKKDGMTLLHYGVDIEPLSLTYLLLKVNGNDKTFKNAEQSLDIVFKNYSSNKELQTIICNTMKHKSSSYFATALISVFYIKAENSHYLQNKFIVPLRKLYYDYNPNFKFYYEDRETFLINLQEAAFRDFKLTIGSLLYIYVFTYIQTRSIFLTIFGITSIFCSFFIANFIHTVFLGIKFFGIFHILAIYIILGIGCDDMYVFLDRWKASQSTEFSSLAHRLTITYISANLSMFITSFTTAIAFSIMIFTPLITLSTFAIFTVLLVIINYISILLYFPSVIILYHLHFETTSKPDPVFMFVTRLFGVHYYNFLQKKYVKDIIVAFFLFLTISSIFVLIFKFEISDQFPSLLDDGTMYAYVEKLKHRCFKEHNFEEPLQISLVFGLAGVSSAHCKFWQYNCRLKLLFDTTYDIKSSEVQISLLNLCGSIKNADDTLVKELAIKKTDNNFSDITCFMLDMDKYFLNKYTSSDYFVPWNIKKFQKFVSRNPVTYNKANISDNFLYYFESAMDFWLFQGYKYTEESKKITQIYKRILYRQVTNQTVFLPGGISYGFKLVTSLFVINTTIYTLSGGYKERVRIYDRWIKFKNDLNKKLPTGANRMMVCSTQLDMSGNGYFHWLWVQRIINSVVLKGIFLGLCLVFPILLLGTMNIFQTCYILLATSLTALSIVTFLPIMGWKLGFLEGTNLTLIVGLSVDYLVHMGLSYHRSESLTSHERMRDMLIEMPVSVISGALTTLGASSFLFFCRVKFLFQFGFFLFITIGFATLYSLIFYPSFIGRFGTHKGVGHLPNIFKRFNH